MLLTMDKVPVDSPRLKGKLAVYNSPVEKYKVQLTVQFAPVEDKQLLGNT